VVCRGIDVAGGGDRALAPVRLRAALREAIDHPPMLTLLVATVVFALAHTQMYTLFTVYLADELGLSKLEIGLTYMVNGVLVLTLQWWALGAIGRLGVTRILPLAALVFAAGYFAVGLATGLATAMAAIAIITVAEVAFAPAHQTAAADSGDAARLGKSFGLVSWAQTVGIAFAPLVGGALFDAIGHHHVALWSCVAGGCLVLAALLARYGRQRAATTAR
jgi:predicted MFS family arabinose efflux permease